MIDMFFNIVKHTFVLSSIASAALATKDVLGHFFLHPGLRYLSFSKYP